MGRFLFFWEAAACFAAFVISRLLRSCPGTEGRESISLFSQSALEMEGVVEFGMEISPPKRKADRLFLRMWGQQAPGWLDFNEEPGTI